MPEYNFKIATDQASKRLDVFLFEQLSHLPSRSFVKKLIDGKQICVNQKAKKAGYKLDIGDEITVSYQEEDLPDDRIKPENLNLDIFYEDSDLVIINKPIGMTVHPAAGKYSGTLVNGLVYHFKYLSDINGERRPGIVHRLDKETSGLIVIAKNNVAHARLAAQFEKRKVYKQYIALVQGKIPFEEGVIDAPIGLHPKFHDHRIVNTYDDKAKPAVTFYKVYKRFEKATLVKLYPKTGRTHQLRLHMKYLGHPILGDDKYGAKQLFPRLALHAQSIEFNHPVLKKRIGFCSAIPDEFLNF